MDKSGHLTARRNAYASVAFVCVCVYRAHALLENIALFWYISVKEIKIVISFVVVDTHNGRRASHRATATRSDVRKFD